MQNKCIRFCLKLNKMHHISEEDFKAINWLPVREIIMLGLRFLFVKLTWGRKVSHIWSLSLEQIAKFNEMKH